jgi:dTDP-glucose pyrophosphorylase
MNNHKYKSHLIFYSTSVKEALEKLNALALDAILFVVDNENKLIGSLTDGDIRRGLIKGLNIEQSVKEYIQANPKFLYEGDININELINFRKSNFKIIPLVNKEKVIVDIINFRNHSSLLPVDALIMAGGIGKRLQPLTLTTPKPLLKVGEKPIIEHNIDRLSKFGIENIWISLKYLGDQIQEYFGDGKEKEITINYIWEDQPLGTIGSIRKVNTFSHDIILIQNSDLLTNINYEDFFLDFIESEADFSIVGIPYQVNIPYAIMETNAQNTVIDFKEKPTFTYYANGGIYLMKKELINLIPVDTFFDATDLIDKLITIGKKVHTYQLAGYWLDIGKHEDFHKAQTDINHITL